MKLLFLVLVGLFLIKEYIIHKEAKDEQEEAARNREEEAQDEAIR